MTSAVRFLMGLLKEGSQRVVVEPKEHLSSPDGFLREAAVQALADEPQAGTLPMLLERLNDWVPQVRSAAQAAVRAQMQTDCLPDWIASLEALVRLGQASRVDHTATFQEVALFLQRPEHLPAVLAASKTSSLRVRRYVFDMQWMTAQDEAARFQLLEEALCGDDVVVAARALSHLETLTSLDLRRQLYQTACKARYALVRYAGVRWLVDHPDALTDNLVRGLGLDPSASVRWWCLRWLRAHGGLAPIVNTAENAARDEAASARLRVVAMHWLREADPDKAAQVSTEWLDHAQSVLRHEALTVQLLRSQGDAKAQWLERAFDDPSPRVRKLLMHKAHRGHWMPSVSRLMATLLKEPTTDSVRRVLAMRRLYAVWDRLECLLVAWPLGPLLGCEAELTDALNRWRWESASCSHGPDAGQSQRITALWLAARHQVAPHLQREIDFHLKTFSVQ